ncbi:MAG TPA: acyl-CoA mutase large subunit family protein, partial [Terriglobales bacterium]|nr:acyl-CoA mutase large subunit family protein [Terriglobales bacterium]
MSTAGASTPNGKLLTEFPTPPFEEWRKLVQTELKDVPFEKKMFSSTYEGIKLSALYRREDVANLPQIDSFPGVPPFLRGATPGGYLQHPWDISQEIAFSSPTEFNNAARNYISRGLNALNMMLDRATRDGHDPDWAQPEEVGSGGLSIASLQDLERALDGIDVEKTTLLIRCGASGMPMAALLVALTRKRKKTPASLRGCIETDPLGVLSHEGRLPQSLGQAYEEMAMLTRWAAENAPSLQTICVHSRAWHESGANAVQELAFTLATAVEYLRAMTQRNCPVDLTAPRIRFAVTVGVNFFMEIAKVRALRMLWSRVVSAAGGNEAAQRLSLHIRTSRWNKTAVDPYNNMLRTTVEAFAGVVGGCDSMQVGAFDEVIRPPDDFSQRIARNTQLVLQHECNLDRVIDPAGGSWYVENLTAELAKRAWALFQEIENAGGMEAALRAGMPQKLTTATAAEKLQAVAKRRDSIVGVNQYADPKQKPLERPAVDPATFHKRRVQQVVSYRTSMEEDASELVLQRLAAVINAKPGTVFEACIDAVGTGATLGEVTRAVRISDGPSAPIEPVRITRAAAGYEELRGRMDAYAARHGKPATVFLCNMGPLKEHKARADFSRGFLAAGGFEVLSPEGFKSAEEAAAAFAGSGAPLAVICSTDAN